MEDDCRKLIPFLTGEINQKENGLFIKHINKCKSCSKEYEEMRDAWNALQYDFVEKEVPHSLKREVMNYVLEKGQKKSPIRRCNFWLTSLKKQFTPLASALLLFLTGLVLFLALNINSINHNFGGVLQDKPDPTEVLSTLTVQAADITNKHITGLAAVIQEGQTEKLIVQIENLPDLKDSEVYQVWLLKSGERANAGIFKPNENGTGMVTFQLNKDSQFDQIGITVEPDETSIQPRGKKIAGTG